MLPVCIYTASPNIHTARVKQLISANWLTNNNLIKYGGLSVMIAKRNSRFDIHVEGREKKVDMARESDQETKTKKRKKL